MHETPLLINIAVALVIAFAGGFIARRLRLPTIIGYLLAGIAIGPFTPGFVGDVATISQLAELGVIFLMFGVGLHFSLKDLWQVRGIAIPGALCQMALTTLIAFGLSQLWGWTPAAGIVLGLAISIASTVVLLRGLIDNGLLNSPAGQAAVGWLVLEDIATVLILVLMPSLIQTSVAAGGFSWQSLGITLLKAAAFAVLALFIGARLIPWLLMRIARTRSRELFILAVLAIALGIALEAAEIFGISLALGAFVAGVVVGESPLSHQAGADALPFQETFSALFFVSIGMLINPGYLGGHILLVIALSAVIIVGKPLLVVLLGYLFPWPARSALVVAAGLSQIGEFSFILGQAGVKMGVLSQDQYSLILAGALFSIMLNPLAFRLIAPIEKRLQQFPDFWKRFNRHGPAPLAIDESISGHVVLTGYGRVGRHIASVLEEISIPYLVVDADAGRIEALRKRGVQALFGDPSNSEVLKYSGLSRARALVVTLPDEAASQLVVAAAREMAPELPIITRAASEAGVERLARLGAQHVIHPELEGGLEIVRHTLLELGFPLQEISRYTDAVRQDLYDLQVNTKEEHRLLHNLLGAASNIEISWVSLQPEHLIVGQSLEQADIRRRTGASVVAILRDRQLMANPKSATIFAANDRIGLIGDQAQIEAAERLLVASDQQDAL